MTFGLRPSARSRSSTLLAVLLLAGLVPLTGSPVAAQGTPEVAVTDALDDVVLLAPDSPAATPQKGGIDIVGARLFGETGQAIILQVEFDQMIEELSYPQPASNHIIVIACFTWNGQQMATRVRFQQGIGTAQLMTNDVGAVDGECAPGQDVSFSKQKVLYPDILIDMSNNLMTMSLKREKLGALTGRPPELGDAMGNLFVTVYDGNRVRFDSAPDGGPAAETLTLQYATANQGQLAASTESNVGDAVLSCNGRVDYPIYAVEVGGVRGVPVILRNEGTQPMDVNLDVRTVGGEDWNPQIVPRLEVPPASEAGNYTATVIVTVPESAQHKDCTIVTVRGRDADGDSLAESGVIVTAVEPPSRSSNRLYLHTGDFGEEAGTCVASLAWLNVLDEDPDDFSRNIMLKNCRDAAYLTTAPAGIQFRLDVNPNHDIILNTSAADARALLHLNLISEHVPTQAHIYATLITLEGEDLGTGELLNQEIGTAVTSMEIPIRVAFTRDEVAEGDPSRTVLSSDGLALHIRFVPQPPQTNLEGINLAGRVSLVSDGTWIDLPIWDTIKRNAREPGRSGALLSLHPSGVLPQFAYPGAARLFNFTVLNEGARDDTAVVTVSFAGAGGWTSQVLPGAELKLPAGRRVPFTVVVQPPATAEESESVVADVVVASKNDPTARASIASRVIATREFGTPQEQAPLDEVVEADGGLLPGPGPLVALLIVGAAAAWRRRRHA